MGQIQTMMMKYYYRNCTFVREESEVEGFASIFDQSVPSRGRECVQSPFYHRQSLVMRIIIIVITTRPWAAFDRQRPPKEKCLEKIKYFF